MSYVRNLVSLVLGPILLASGCLAPLEGDEEVGELGAPVSGSPTDSQRIILNGLPMSLFEAHRASLIQLVGGSLTSHAITKSGLLESAEGRQLFGYVIKCSLGWDDVLSVPYQGSTYLFEGGVGLALNWRDGALTAPEKRWLSACLLAHSNAFGIKVPLSLRGNHPALATTPEEVDQYPVEEGAFYGDLFTAPGIAASMFACPGLGFKDSCEVESNEWLDVRVCAAGAGTLSQCGFYVPGDCYNYAVASPGACSEIDADGYGACRPTMALDAPAYAEVITVYLRRSEGSPCGSDA